ncbi:hypothetical protein H072_8184 [Dactylellina haptotyla CBS 200.50]|uniref:Non-structural maintenance of chromosomes element 1 homolog n=1 Tax=Dactylellina haptotyla (strain CBS 200.50) TaxID=1284197 RepID=S8AAF4_DACHA|nr:hypothetical protein H072_8184 [Dactylellina haptotyla CBS 200.50]
MVGSYTNVHRTFLQALLIRPFIDIEEGQELLAAIASAESGTDVPANSITVKQVSDILHTIQNAISPFDLDLRDMLDQEDGKRYYSLINSADDEIIRFATTHTPDEISYFKRLLDEMFDTNNTRYAEIMAVTSVRAISLNKNPPAERENRVIATQGANGEEATQVFAGAGIGLTKLEAEDCLTRFVDEGWLERNSAGFHFLSTRALLELELYLNETYNVEEEEEHEDGTVTRGARKQRIKTCHVCKYIHTIGQRCSDVNCNLRIHNHCADEYFSKAALKCPTCAADWKGDPVGPRAARGGGGGRDAGLRRAKGRDSEGILPQRLSKAVKKSIEKSKVRRSTMFNGGDISEETGDSPPPRPSGSRNSLGRRNREETDDEEDNEQEGPPRKLSRILNGTSRRSSTRRLGQELEDENDEDEDEAPHIPRSTNSTNSTTVRIKRENMKTRRAEGSHEEGEEDDDDHDEHELPHRMSKTSLQSRRR